MLLAKIQGNVIGCSAISFLHAPMLSRTELQATQLEPGSKGTLDSFISPKPDREADFAQAAPGSKGQTGNQ
jgi:hypothetical protein